MESVSDFERERKEITRRREGEKKRQTHPFIVRLNQQRKFRFSPRRRFLPRFIEYSSVRNGRSRQVDEFDDPVRGTSTKTKGVSENAFEAREREGTTLEVSGREREREINKERKTELTTLDW